MKSLIRRIVAAAAAITVAAGISAVSANPAQALSDGPAYFDVTKYKAGNLVIGNSNCRNTTVTMSHKKSGFSEWDVYASITGPDGGIENSVSYGHKSNKAKAAVSICPWSSRSFGRYTVGPSSIFANNADYTRSVYGDDFTKGHFYVRGKTKAGLSTKRKGKKVTLTATAKRYNPTYDRYTAHSPKAKIQVKSGKKWKTIKTVTLTKGKKSVTVTSKAKRTYRVTFGSSSKYAGATSKAVRR